MKRNEQLVENTWNLCDIYANEELVQEEMNLVKELIKELKEYQGKLHLGANLLFDLLEIYEKIEYYYGRLIVYSNESLNGDVGNSYYQKMCGDVDLIGLNLYEATSFMEPEILSIADCIDQYMEDCKQLKKYQRFLSMITFKKEHVLQPEIEALLARARDLSNASNIFDMLNQADFRFNSIHDENGKEYPLTHGTFIKYLTGKDRVLRKDAYETLYSEYKKYNNSLGAIFNANVKEANFFAKERKYKNTMEAELGENEIPTDVYFQLLDSIHEHLSALHEYVGLRKKILGLDDLKMYDIYVPLTTLPERKYDFEEAKKIVLDGLSILGEDYINLLKEGFDHRWIDIYENEGKATGAHSWGCYGTHPYVLLNYSGTLNDVFTLAHEMGHSIHTYYSNEKQNLLNSQYRIFVAEVASTCNESLLIHYLMDQTDNKEEKKYLINYFLDQFKGTMFRQSQFAEFEMLTHEIVEKGETITPERLNSIYYDLNQKYYGPSVGEDDYIQYEWSRIPHFYTPFYVYQYSTGFAAAIAISTKILKGEEGIIEKYKEFLSGGSSMNPIDLLKICDVDMSKKDPVDNALKVFEEYLEEFKKLLD